VGEPSKLSREQFTRIDKQTVLDFAAACKRAGVSHFELLEFKCVPFTEELLYGDLYKQPRE
jgi:hypothetical protein